MDSAEYCPPEKLLLYHPVYPILICTECRYAIQPTGIARHLKEIHSIYRSRRRPYMDYARRLQLAKPGDMANVEIIEFPVSHLPVLDGLQCMGHKDCRYLCVSTKRMQNHWLSVHGRHGDAANGAWRAAPLQTFFRGNSLHYFTGTSRQYNEQGHDAGFKPEVGASARLLSRAAGDSMDEIDEYLLRHYVNSTSLTLVDRHGKEHIWQQTLPQMASQHSFLMHALLACAALHLAHQNPPQRQDYLIRARIYQDRAWPLFNHAISNVTKHNASAILAFAHLLVVYSFATDDDGGDNQHLLVADATSPHAGLLCTWLYFVRNGCLLMCKFWDEIESGPLASIAKSWGSPIPGVDEGPACAAATGHLLSLMPDVQGNDDGFEPWSAEIRNVFSGTAAQLGWAFAASWVLADAEFTTWDAVRVWPMHISQEYTDLLLRGHPAALVLLAHYCLLLERLEPHWYFEGRAVRLLDSILARLDSRWQSRTRWSRQRMGDLAREARI